MHLNKSNVCVCQQHELKYRNFIKTTAKMILAALANKQPNTDSVLLNARTLSTGILQKTSALLQNPKCWHRFIVTNTDGLSRNEILKAVLDGVHPLDLIPVFYTKDQLNANSYFMARNCEAAIRQLCDNNW
ncbi:hypothetical protein HUJ04_009569 [Dendroctonus ponderosae]|nr:hypothetical protein HUJ04_009569 [Dendroctonus ponderosae]